MGKMVISNVCVNWAKVLGAGRSMVLNCATYREACAVSGQWGHALGACGLTFGVVSP